MSVHIPYDYNQKQMVVVNLQEHHSLQPVNESIKARYQKLTIHHDIYATGAIVTASTGFANEAKMKYLHERRDQWLYSG